MNTPLINYTVPAKIAVPVSILESISRMPGMQDQTPIIEECIGLVDSNRTNDALTLAWNTVKALNPEVAESLKRHAAELIFVNESKLRGAGLYNDLSKDFLQANTILSETDKPARQIDYPGAIKMLKSVIRRVYEFRDGLRNNQAAQKTEKQQKLAAKKKRNLQNKAQRVP